MYLHFSPDPATDTIVERPNETAADQGHILYTVIRNHFWVKYKIEDLG